MNRRKRFIYILTMLIFGIVIYGLTMYRLANKELKKEQEEAKIVKAEHE